LFLYLGELVELELIIGGVGVLTEAIEAETAGFDVETVEMEAETEGMEDKGAVVFFLSLLDSILLISLGLLLQYFCLSLLSSLLYTPILLV